MLDNIFRIYCRGTKKVAPIWARKTIWNIAKVIEQ